MHGRQIKSYYSESNLGLGFRVIFRVIIKGKIQDQNSRPNKGTISGPVLRVDIRLRIHCKDLWVKI
jgi:hypothetical protein